MKTEIEWNGRTVEIDTEDRMILLDDHGVSSALLYIPGMPTHLLIALEGASPAWQWNGSKDKPTFYPSILTRLPWGEDRREIRNHVFIRDGVISYLSDCTHEYAGRSMELPRLCEWPEEFDLWSN